MQLDSSIHPNPTCPIPKIKVFLISLNCNDSRISLLPSFLFLSRSLPHPACSNLTPRLFCSCRISHFPTHRPPPHLPPQGPRGSGTQSSSTSCY